jgi:hypothetical protein
MQRQPLSSIVPHRRVENCSQPVDQAAPNRSRLTSNPLYPALTAPPSQNNSETCEANNDGILLSAFQFLIAFPNSMARPDFRNCSLRPRRSVDRRERHSCASQGSMARMVERISVMQGRLCLQKTLLFNRTRHRRKRTLIEKAKGFRIEERTSTSYGLKQLVGKNQPAISNK